MTIEERNIAANVRIMNDQIKKQCFLNYEQFVNKVREELPGYQMQVYGALVPITFNYPRIENKNYYIDFIKLLFNL